MQGAQWGKLVQVQHCPATVTPLVKSDDPPFMTHNTSWKGKLGIGIILAHTDLALPPNLGGFDLMTFSHRRSFLVYVRKEKMKFRTEHLMLSAFLTLVLILVNVSSVAASSLPSSTIQVDANSVIKSGFDYIASQRNEDGGIRWTDENSNVSASIRVVLALAAAHYPQDYLISASGNRPIDFLAEVGSDWINQTKSDEPGFSVARAGQLLMAVSAANENPRQFGPESLDLVTEIKSHYDQNSGIFGSANAENVTDQVWAMLGLASCNAAIPMEAADWLLTAQLDEGSWNDGWGGFLDMTPLAVMALAASDQNNTYESEIQAAANFMRSNQQEEGGWLTEWDTITNADTTGIMLQAIAAMGQLPMDQNWQRHDGNPFTALFTIQKENGAIGGDFANAFSTADAIIGLSGEPLYDLGYLKKISKGFNFILSTQNSDGGWGSVGQTIDVILALKAAGWDPNSIQRSEETPLTFIENNATAYIESGPDAIGKAIMGIVALSENTTDFNGIDLVSTLMVAYDQDEGAFGNPDNTWHQALAILGLHAAHESIPQGVVAALEKLQQEDGGWEYTTDSGTMTDSTALAIQALLAAGKPQDDVTIQAGIDYIKSSQTNDGDWGDSSNTAYALMAINALNQSPADWKSASGMAPLPALFSYQKTNGSFVFNWEYSDDNLLSTTAALLAALAGDYLIEPPESDGIHYAALVIDPGEGDVTTACVAFEEETLSGLELLDKSGLDYEIDEGFVNNIIGFSAQEGETLYWSFWYFDGREWQFHNTGAGESIVEPTTIEAWRLTNWEQIPSPPPDFIPNLKVICNADILKDYAVQPYLNYEDITWSSQATETSPEEIVTHAIVDPTEGTPPFEQTVGKDETNTPADIDEVLDEEKETPASQKNPSIVPLLIIVGIGTIIIIIILILVLRKNK